MTTASAIATIERLAPGRLACAWGTGMTARRAMGQNALTWQYTRTYLEQLRGLLNGEVVEIEGKPCKMLQHPEMATARPIAVPFIISAFGPKGVAITREIGDGWMGSAGASAEGFEWAVQMQSCTVLSPGESPYSDRVMAAAGPWHAGIWHSTWEWNRDALPTIPGGPAFLETINESPEPDRHFAVHYSHVTHLNEADRNAFRSIDSKPDWVVMVGEADEILTKVKAMEASGITDILYTPAGDFLYEAEMFYNAVKSLQG